MAVTNPISELEDENGNILGIAAKGLDTPVKISLTGNVTGDSGNTDLSGNVAITTTIANGSVTESKIATDAVTNGKVKDGELTKAKLNASAYNETDGTIADGTNANLATKTQVKAYVESVLSSEGHYKGVQSVATINTWTAANLHNGDRVITSSDPAGSGTGTLTLGNLPVVDGQEVIFYVSDDQSVKIWQSSEGNYKIKQAAKTDPTASGTTITAIDSITQNSNGEITATKKTIRSGTTSQTGIVQLKGSIAASESDDSKAATPKAVRDAINALDVAEVGGSGKYIKAISEVNGKVAATEETMDTTPTANSQKAITSGGVKAAIDALDAASVGGNGKIISAISETDGIISATAKTMDSVPTVNHTDTTVTSAGIKAALDAVNNSGVIVAKTASDADIPNNRDSSALRNVYTVAGPYTRFVLLYEVTDFFNGVISNVENEASAFEGIISRMRTNGVYQSQIATVSAGIGYNSSSTSLLTNDVRYMPVVAKRSISYIGIWNDYKGYVIGEVGSAVNMTPETSGAIMCVAVDVSNVSTLYVNAGFSQSSHYASVGHVWAFLDSSNKVIAESSNNGVNGPLSVPAGAVKFVCNSRINGRPRIGVSDTPKYFLAIKVSFAVGSDYSLFGRFITRTEASGGISARPLLLETITNAGSLNISDIPAGWTIQREGGLFVNAATADAAREGSALETAIDSKVDKVTGKGLSTNDFTNAYKDKVDANTSARHTHSNKSVLDGITAEKVAAWDDKQERISWMDNTETDALFTAAWDAANA